MTAGSCFRGNNNNKKNAYWSTFCIRIPLAEPFVVYAWNVFVKRGIKDTLTRVKLKLERSCVVATGG